MRAFLVACVALVAAQSVSATWSVVALDRRTRELCVGSATCIANGDVHRLVPIVAVDKGVAASQFSPSPAQNAILFDLLQQELPPPEILSALQAGDAVWPSRQYGILNFSGPPVTFSGNFTDEWTGGFAGQIGSIAYAVQGNSLASLAVMEAARDALIVTQGDLGQKVMAAMEAASAQGGDGRCSCDSVAPTSCGTPPPNFTHTAFTASLVLSRVGDVDGSCGGLAGCANGQYYLKRKVSGNAQDADAIVRLREKYDAWRAARIGRPDHLNTRILPSATRAVADGTSVVTVTLELRDIEDQPLTSGGQTITIEDLTSGAPVATLSALTDNGDGTHTFELQTTQTTGLGEWRIRVVDGVFNAQLYPNLTLSVDPVTALHVGVVRAWPQDETRLPFTLNLGPAFAGRPYQLLGSASGTSPGTTVLGQLVPLNEDRLFAWTRDHAQAPSFVGASGVLDGSGRAQAELRLSAAGLGALAPARLDFCALLIGASGADLTNLVAVDLR